MASPRRSRRWSWTTGEKGKNRVRAFDRGSRGIFLEMFARDPATGLTARKRIALGRVDHGFARRKAEELATCSGVMGARKLPPLPSAGSLTTTKHT